MARCYPVVWDLARRLAFATALHSGRIVTGFHQDLCLKERNLFGDDRFRAVVMEAKIWESRVSMSVCEVGGSETGRGINMAFSSVINLAGSSLCQFISEECFVSGVVTASHFVFMTVTIARWSE